MKKLLPVLLYFFTFVPLFAGTVPEIDRQKPAHLETATFALG